MKNLLMISVDDLFAYDRFRTKFGVTIETPNFDRLAAMGTRFDAAYAATPLCAPSRASVLSGQTPFETGIFNNVQSWGDTLTGPEMLPAVLHGAGWETARIGKVMHQTSVDPAFVGNMFAHQYDPVGLDKEDYGYRYGVGPAPAGIVDADFADHDAAMHVAGLLQAHQGPEPFAIFAGLHRPHHPMVVPQQYFDMYPLSSIVAAGFPDAAVAALPEFAQQFVKGDNPAYAALRIQGYLASVSFADAMLGLMLDAMDTAGLWATTTVVFWSDHGYQLGDHDTWAKFSLWEEAASAPLIVVDPDQDAAGSVVTVPVSMTQIFPTLMDLMGVQRPSTVSAESFAGLIDGSFGTYQPEPVLTYIYGSLSMRWGDHRLIRYEDGSFELYDLVADPAQVMNLALDPAHDTLLASLTTTMATEAAAKGVILSDALDVLNGTAGVDRLVADDADLQAIGGAGDDVYFVTARTNVIEKAGGGTDTVVLRSSMAGADPAFLVGKEVEIIRVGLVTGKVVVTGRIGNDDIVSWGGAMEAWGRSGNDKAIGADGADSILGGIGNDALYGGRGSDTIAAGSGDDRIVAGAGDDSVREGIGRDIVSLGPGRDVLTVMPGSDTVRVLDFKPADDTLAFEGFRFIDADAVLAAFTAFGSGVRLVAEGMVMTLDGVALSDLSPSDFLLLPAGAGAVPAAGAAQEMSQPPDPPADLLL